MDSIFWFINLFILCFVILWLLFAVFYVVQIQLLSSKSGNNYHDIWLWSIQMVDDRISLALATLWLWVLRRVCCSLLKGFAGFGTYDICLCNFYLHCLELLWDQVYIMWCKGWICIALRAQLFPLKCKSYLICIL